jgi:hypothetical protein
MKGQEKEEVKRERGKQWNKGSIEIWIGSEIRSVMKT